ncbi:MAG: hypothetical protein JWM33_2155 [Caulobacteraceae bacterium]|nr:hypothetical protein [Caulobacteraceae bacterium]
MTPEQPAPTLMPKLSVIVANFNGAAHLDACLRSLTRQSLSNLEIIVIDDGSTDDSVARLSQWAATDDRVVVLTNRGAKGPAGARTTGLAAARGEWFGIVDSDDLVFARRFETLIGKAEADGADIAADDQLIFYDDDWSSRRFLKGRRARQDTWITTEEFLDENHMFSGTPNLGFLKPVIRRARLGSSRYDEGLRIAEDFDLIVRLLCDGAHYRLYPNIHYLYRKHSASISHVLSGRDVEQMMLSHEALVAGLRAQGRAVSPAFPRRFKSLQTSAAFTQLVDTIKAKNIEQALKIAAGDPAAALLLRLPVLARLSWRRTKTVAASPVQNRASCCLISRQRIIGPTNGSSTYILAIARAIRDCDVDVHLLQPSPTVFGRWPALFLRPEMKVFSSIRIRGAAAIGPLRIATDPRIVFGAIRTVLGQALAKAGIRVGWLQTQPAAYSIGAPWTNDDLVFVARHAPRLSDIVMFDYAFQTVASPYILRDEPTRFMVMHDLFSSRDNQFSALNATDSVTSLSMEEENVLLSGADVTLAIQKEEAAYVAAAVPGQKVLTTMMPVTPVALAQPGDARTVLFVGSSAAPNVNGLGWFIDKVLPLLSKERPDLRILVAGSVARAFPQVPPGMEMLGVVPDLTKLYQQAGVVISPLQAGSGLKIKLVEALAHGKAMVATPTTLQGVTEEVSGAVVVADTPDRFAKGILSLLADQDQRTRLAEAALTAALTHFSPEACMESLQAAIKDAVHANISLNLAR